MGTAARLGTSAMGLMLGMIVLVTSIGDVQLVSFYAFGELMILFAWSFARGTDASPRALGMLWSRARLRLFWGAVVLVGVLVSLRVFGVVVPWSISLPVIAVILVGFALSALLGARDAG